MVQTQTQKQHRGRRREDEDEDEDEGAAPRRAQSPREPSPAVQKHLRAQVNDDEDRGIERVPAPESDRRVVVMFKENVAPYKEGEIAAVSVAYANAAVKKDYAEVYGDGVPRPRSKRGDWINNQPKHNATGGVAASGGTALNAAALADLGKALATAAQTTALQEEVLRLTGELHARDDEIKDLGARLAALEKVQQKK